MKAKYFNSFGIHFGQVVNMKLNKTNKLETKIV